MAEKQPKDDFDMNEILTGTPAEIEKKQGRSYKPPEEQISLNNEIIQLKTALKSDKKDTEKLKKRFIRVSNIIHTTWPNIQKLKSGKEKDNAHDYLLQQVLNI